MNEFNYRHITPATGYLLQILFKVSARKPIRTESQRGTSRQCCNGHVPTCYMAYFIGRIKQMSSSGNLPLLTVQFGHSTSSLLLIEVLVQMKFGHSECVPLIITYDKHIHLVVHFCPQSKNSRWWYSAQVELVFMTWNVCSSKYWAHKQEKICRGYMPKFSTVASFPTGATSGKESITIVQFDKNVFLMLMTTRNVIHILFNGLLIRTITSSSLSWQHAYVGILQWSNHIPLW